MQADIRRKQQDLRRPPAQACSEGGDGPPPRSCSAFVRAKTAPATKAKGKVIPWALAPPPVMSKCASVSLHEVASFAGGSRSAGFDPKTAKKVLITHRVSGMTSAEWGDQAGYGMVQG